MNTNVPDWADKPLSELTQNQWESLCDGCGKCCMVKLQDVDTNEIYYTNVACELFEAASCRCTDYARRTTKIPGCISLSLANAHAFEWLPQSCAYRLRFESKPLPQWHPLISGDPESTHQSGHSVKHRTVAAKAAGPLEYHLVDWLNE